jgi:transposase
MTLVPPYFILF